MKAKAPEQKTFKRFNARITNEHHSFIQRKAKSDGITESEAHRQMLTSFIEHNTI